MNNLVSTVDLDTDGTENGRKLLGRSFRESSRRSQKFPDYV